MPGSRGGASGSVEGFRGDEVPWSPAGRMSESLIIPGKPERTLKHVFTPKMGGPPEFRYCQGVLPPAPSPGARLPTRRTTTQTARTHSGPHPPLLAITSLMPASRLPGPLPPPFFLRVWGLATHFCQPEAPPTPSNGERGRASTERSHRCISRVVRGLFSSWHSVCAVQINSL